MKFHLQIIQREDHFIIEELPYHSRNTRLRY